MKKLRGKQSKRGKKEKNRHIGLLLCLASETN